MLKTVPLLIPLGFLLETEMSTLRNYNISRLRKNDLTKAKSRRFNHKNEGNIQLLLFQTPQIGQSQLLFFTIHQIFSLARDWSKHVTRPNNPDLDWLKRYTSGTVFQWIREIQITLAYLTSLCKLFYLILIFYLMFFIVIIAFFLTMF